MPSRRPHKKTRHGCSTCKARRVRCDEEKPVCRNCKRGNRECSYSQVYGQVYSQALSLPPFLASTHAESPEPIFPMRDLELLHHFTAFTCETLAPNAHEVELWRRHVPQMAFSNRFLLHGILALAALHIRHDRPDREKESLMSIARYHQQHALTLYIPLLQDINQQNCDALFAFSLLLSCLCYAMLQGNHDDPQNVVCQLIDVFDALVGCTAIAIEGREWLYDGRFRSVLLQLSPQESDFTSLDHDFRSALEALRRCVAIYLPNPSDEDSIMRHRAYQKGIWALAAVMAMTPGKRQLSIVCSWAVMVEGDVGDFIALLKRRDPMALLILGHYAVAVHQFGRLWSMEGLGRQLAEAIYQELDERWQPYLVWALNKVGEPISQQETPSVWEDSLDTSIGPQYPLL
ncbi:Sterol uptake control 2 [Lecanosticta acicola]|uniref:Sterol uptake control 2 n=1 Tax=Lecanosticta acicola TaxID=111012 RepID=A0AAI8Z1V2_9PEZI|nr:Sterol uptake control 2 [Lecanosticta acicola]